MFLLHGVAPVPLNARTSQPFLGLIAIFIGTLCAIAVGCAQCRLLGPQLTCVVGIPEAAPAWRRDKGAPRPPPTLRREGQQLQNPIQGLPFLPLAGSIGLLSTDAETFHIHERNGSTVELTTLPAPCDRKDRQGDRVPAGVITTWSPATEVQVCYCPIVLKKAAVAAQECQ